MLSKEKLFNVDILVLASERVKLLKEVKVGNIFTSSTKNFDPEGLFSTEIFGTIGSRMRNEQYGYINLGLPILHPYVFDMLMSLSSKYIDIVEGRKYAKFDKALGDFIITEKNEGSTGYHYFLNHIDKLKFNDNNSDQRLFRIKLVEKYAKPEYFIKHWLVIPAGLRDYTEDDKGAPSEDEINNLYRKLLGVTNMVKNTNVGENLELLDPIRLKIQKCTLEIFTYIRTLIDGKYKFIQGKFAKRSIKYGTRNVLTPIPAKIKNLKDTNNISLNDTQVGLYQYIKAISPITINKVQSMFIHHILNPNSDQAYLINTETLKTELVRIPAKARDEWLSVEGMTGIMNKLGQSDIRLEPVKVDKYYLALVHDDGKNIKVIFNTEEHDGLNKKHIRPITYAELFYISIYDCIKKYPCLVTRYPVGSLGGIYPSNVYVKTTIKARTVNLEFGVLKTTMIEYPIMGELFVESVSVNINKISRLGADKKSLNYVHYSSNVVCESTLIQWNP